MTGVSERRAGAHVAVTRLTNFLPLLILALGLFAAANPTHDAEGRRFVKDPATCSAFQPCTPRPATVAADPLLDGLAVEATIEKAAAKMGLHCERQARVGDIPAKMVTVTDGVVRAGVWQMPAPDGAETVRLCYET